VLYELPLTTSTSNVAPADRHRGRVGLPLVPCLPMLSLHPLYPLSGFGASLSGFEHFLPAGSASPGAFIAAAISVGCQGCAVGLPVAGRSWCHWAGYALHGDRRMVVRGQIANHSLWTMAFVFMSVSICYCLLGLQERWALLQACLSLGECVVASVVLLAMEFNTGDGSTTPLPTWALSSGLLEGSLVLAWALGANLVDAVTGLFLVYAVQLRNIVSVEGRSFRSEVSRIARPAWTGTPNRLAITCLR
jgi:hypothetical protein